jgi:hypothetical protein
MADLMLKSMTYNSTKDAMRYGVDHIAYIRANRRCLQERPLRLGDR